MGALVLDILLVGLAAVIGSGAGWFLRGGSAPAPLPETDEELKRAKEEAKKARGEAKSIDMEAAHLRKELEKARLEAERSREAIGELHRVAGKIAADVDEHKSSMKEISRGLDEKSTAEEVVDAVKQLLEANAAMERQLSEAEERLEEQQKEIATHVAEARTDPLTGLNNRRAFDDEMERCSKDFQEHGRPSCLMMIDVDKFKKFNDTYGHQAGDEVLRGVARVLSDNIPDREVVCRYGGEEFCVIFPGSDISAARAAAERARAAIADAIFTHEGRQLKVTASGGLAEFMADESSDDMVKRADDALYVCKKAGRNCGHWHDGENIIPMTETMVMRQALMDATNEDAADAVKEESLGDADAAKDRLTGLSSKAAFKEDVERRLAEWRRGGPAVSVVAARIDRFNELSADQGPLIAETLIKAAGRFIAATMRDMDHVSRYDVADFAALLPNANRDDAVMVAERARQVIELCKLPAEDEGLLTFTISIGVAEAVKGDTTDNLINRALQAVVTAEERGGNSVVNGEELDAAAGAANAAALAATDAAETAAGVANQASQEFAETKKEVAVEADKEVAV